MMKCPVCTVAIDSPVAACPRCKADLSLLSHFMSDVRTLLEKPDSLREQGQLPPAVETYLEVLEADPGNVEARAGLGPNLRALRPTQPAGGGAPRQGTGPATAAAAPWTPRLIHSRISRPSLHAAAE